MSELGDLVRKVFTDKRVEPQKRLVGGSFGWAIHRYPIKGGVDLGTVLADNISANNALLSRMKQRADQAPE